MLAEPITCHVGGGKAKEVALPKLRGRREARGWTEEDLATAVIDLCEELGEKAKPGISGAQVSKWELGTRTPGPYYRARLCVVLECTPPDLGFLFTPTLSRAIRDLMEKCQQRRRLSHALRRGGDGVIIPHVDIERLRATLDHMWPVDDTLLDALDRGVRELAARRDTEPAAEVIPELSPVFEMLIELVSRSQRPERSRRLRRIASFAGQNLAMASWVTGDSAATYRTYSLAESLARESRVGSQLALVLVDRSEMAGQMARLNDDWEEAVLLADAAETAARADPDTPPGVLAWIYGERSGHRAEMGDDVGSGRDLDRMERMRLGASPDELNIFSPGVDSAWIDAYHVRRALRLGHADEAVSLASEILSATDARLHWERAEALVHMAEAWLLKADQGGADAGGSVAAAAAQLGAAISLLRNTGNARDMREVHRLLNRMRKRWRTAPEVRELDNLLRARS